MKIFIIKEKRREKGRKKIGATMPNEKKIVKYGEIKKIKTKEGASKERELIEVEK